MSKKTKIVTKGVAFNIFDPDQESLLEHAMKRKNFSNYIKRLIQRDIDGAFRHSAPPSTPQQNDEDNSLSLDTGLMDDLV